MLLYSGHETTRFLQCYRFANAWKHKAIDTIQHNHAPTFGCTGSTHRAFP